MCYLDSSNKQVCSACKTNFIFDYKGICNQCPTNCQTCFFGGYYQSKSVNWSELSAKELSLIDFDSLDKTTEYLIMCSQCASLYTITTDYTGCEKCGINCSQCY